MGRSDDKTYTVTGSWSNAKVWKGGKVVYSGWRIQCEAYVNHQGNWPPEDYRHGGFEILLYMGDR